MIKAEKLHKQVKMAESEIRILKGIDLEIKTGESVAIVGASGSGKSTLLAILAGLDLPSHGRVVIDEIDLSSLDEDGRAKFRGDHVGFVFQSFQLLPSLTALENVMLPLELNGNQDAVEAASHYLQRVGLEHRFSHYPAQLSGGEQQRVAIARALAARPKLLARTRTMPYSPHRRGQRRGNDRGRVHPWTSEQDCPIDVQFRHSPDA